MMTTSGSKFHPSSELLTLIFMSMSNIVVQIMYTTLITVFIVSRRSHEHVSGCARAVCYCGVEVGHPTRGRPQPLCLRPSPTSGAMGRLALGMVGLPA